MATTLPRPTFIPSAVVPPQTETQTKFEKPAQVDVRMVYLRYDESQGSGFYEMFVPLLNPHTVDGSMDEYLHVTGLLSLPDIDERPRKRIVSAQVVRTPRFVHNIDERLERDCQGRSAIGDIYEDYPHSLHRFTPVLLPNTNMFGPELSIEEADMHTTPHYGAEGNESVWGQARQFLLYSANRYNHLIFDL